MDRSFRSEAAHCGFKGLASRRGPEHGGSRRICQRRGHQHCCQSHADYVTVQPLLAALTLHPVPSVKRLRLNMCGSDKIQNRRYHTRKMKYQFPALTELSIGNHDFNFRTEVLPPSLTQLKVQNFLETLRVWTSFCRYFEIYRFWRNFGSWRQFAILLTYPTACRSPYPP